MTKNALITGASSGIGLELAKQCSQDGYDVILVARREQELRNLAQEIESAHGVKAHVYVGDLSDPSVINHLMHWLHDEGHQIDVLVNNAGFGDTADFKNANREKLLNMIQLNVTALTDLAHRLLQPMVERNHGYILNVASTAGFMPGPGMAVYFATKNYVLALSEAMTYELRKTGVGVTALCPGAVITGFQERAELTLADSFKNSAMPAADVAAAAYKAMKQGKPYVIPGFMNKVLIKLAQFMPRFMSLKMIDRFSE